MTLPAGFSVDGPFSATGIGDCFLKSSDGIQFKVLKGISAIASPVFRAMFDLPQEVGSSSKPQPIIDVGEDANTLQNFLRFLYPLSAPNVDSFQLAYNLVQTFDKYDMSLDLLQPHLANLFADPEQLRSQPLELYALAWRTRLKPEVAFTSRYTHAIDLQGRQGVNTLLTVSGDIESLLSLQDLRNRREAALDPILQALKLEDMLCPAHGGVSKNGRISGEQLWKAIPELKRRIRQRMQDPGFQAREIGDLGITGALFPHEEPCNNTPRGCFMSDRRIIGWGMGEAAIDFRPIMEALKACPNEVNTFWDAES